MARQLILSYLKLLLFTFISKFFKNCWNLVLGKFKLSLGIFKGKNCLQLVSKTLENDYEYGLLVFENFSIAKIVVDFCAKVQGILKLINTTHQ